MKVGRRRDAPVSIRRRFPARAWPAGLILAWGLAGCAASPGATATCTDLISTGGGLLKFCQAGDKLHVSESGIDPAGPAGDVKIVDDPAVLNALQKQISPRADFAASRRIVAHACVVKGDAFVSISLADLKRIVDAPVRASAAVADGDADANGQPRAGAGG